MSIIQGQQIYQTTAGTFLPVPMSSPTAQAQIVQSVSVPAMRGYQQSSESHGMQASLIPVWDSGYGMMEVALFEPTPYSCLLCHDDIV